MNKYCFIEECTSNNEWNICKVVSKARTSLPLCEINCEDANCLVCETAEDCNKCQTGFSLV